MCKGICKTGYQCEREHWLDANGLCRDHKDQYYIQQRAREHDRFLKRHLERERAFEECTRGPKRIRLSDPLSFHVLPLASPPMTTREFAQEIPSFHVPPFNFRELLPSPPPMAPSAFTQAIPPPNVPQPLPTWFSSPPPVSQCPPPFSWFSSPPQPLPTRFPFGEPTPQQPVPTLSKRFEKLGEHLTNAQKLLESMNEDLEKMQQILLE